MKTEGLRQVFLGIAIVLLSQPCMAATNERLAEKTNVLRKACHPYVNVICPCGQRGGNVSLPIKMCFNNITGEGKCTLCEVKDNDIENVCMSFTNCETCMDGRRKCRTCPVGKSGAFCTKDDPVNEGLAGPLYRFRRTKRSDNEEFPNILLPCEIPDHLNTAELDCYMADNKITCETTCDLMYSYPEGRKRIYRCDGAEKVWKPSYFEECTDRNLCYLTQIQPGNITCFHGRVGSTPLCSISCQKTTEAEEEYAETNHSCSIDGKWTPPLPRCVVVKENPIEDTEASLLKRMEENPLEDKSRGAEKEKTTLKEKEGTPPKEEAETSQKEKGKEQPEEMQRNPHEKVLDETGTKPEVKLISKEEYVEGEENLDEEEQDEEEQDEEEQNEEEQYEEEQDEEGQNKEERDEKEQNEEEQDEEQDEKDEEEQDEEDEQGEEDKDEYGEDDEADYDDEDLAVNVQAITPSRETTTENTKELSTAIRGIKVKVPITGSQKQKKRKKIMRKRMRKPVRKSNKQTD